MSGQTGTRLGQVRRVRGRTRRVVVSRPASVANP
jgi:hypothetical protein